MSKGLFVVVAAALIAIGGLEATQSPGRAATGMHLLKLQVLPHIQADPASSEKQCSKPAPKAGVWVRCWVEENILYFQAFPTESDARGHTNSLGMDFVLLS